MPDAGGTLTLTLSQRARGSEHLGVKFQIRVAHLAPFGSRLLLAARLKMRPQWTHLAFRGHTAHSYHCASMRPRRPRLASSGVARSGETFNSVAFSCIWLHSSRLRGTGCEVPVFTGTTEEWPGVAKLLKPSHLVSFGLIPLVDCRGWGFTLILALHPLKGAFGLHSSVYRDRDRDARFPSSRERRESVAPPPGLSRWDGDRLRWCTLATPGIGPGRSRPRHACRNLGDGGLWRV